MVYKVSRTYQGSEKESIGTGLTELKCLEASGADTEPANCYINHRSRYPASQRQLAGRQANAELDIE